MAKGGYWANVLIGGGTGALDSINGTGLNNLDTAWCRTIDTLYPFTLDATSGIAEESPNVIAPDNNAGTKRGILSGVRCNVLTANALVGTTITVGKILLPQVNSPSNPTLAFGDGNTGFYEESDNVLAIVAAGAKQGSVVNGWAIRAAAAGASGIMNLTPTSTTPILIPSTYDSNTGVGWAGQDMLSLIAGSKEIMRLDGSVGMSVSINGIVDRITLKSTNEPLTPTLAFGAGTTGFYERGVGQLAVSILGTYMAKMSNSNFASATGGSWLLDFSAASSTLPVFTFGSDEDTGIGRAGTNQLSMIAGGVEGIRVWNGAVGGLTVDINGTLEDLTIANRLQLGNLGTDEDIIFKSQTGGLLKNVYHSFWRMSNLEWTMGLNRVGTKFELYTSTFASGTPTISILETDEIVDFGFGLTVPVGTVSAPTIAFPADTGTGIYQPASGAIGLVGNGVEGIRVTTVGLTASVDFVDAVRTVSTVTHNSYVELDIQGTTYKFMLGV